MTNAIKSVILTPEMLGILENGGRATNRIGDGADAYARVPLIYRAARIRCNALLKLPHHLYRDDEETEAEYPFDYPLDKLIWRTRAAGLLTGAGYVLKRANRITVKEIQWLNPTTVTVRWDTNAQRRIFEQIIAGQHFGPWTDDDMVYLPEFTLRDDIQPGDCPASVAMGQAQLSHYMTRMASIFFENGAMPVTLLSAEDGFGNDSEKIENYFRRVMQGIRNAFRVVAVRGKGVVFHTPQFPMKDLATNDLRDQVRKDVALAFEIPVTMLDDDANYATAKEHKRSFYDETIIPDADMFAEEMNEQLFHDLGLHLKFAPEEMDLYQDDERESAEAANRFADLLAKMPDYDTFEFVASTYGMEYDEAQAKKVFANKEQRRAEIAATPQANANEANAPVPPQAKTLKNELEKWERAATKRVQRGGDLGFNSDVIPPTLAASIRGALETARSGDDVKQIFDNAAAWGVYP